MKNKITVSRFKAIIHRGVATTVCLFLVILLGGHATAWGFDFRVPDKFGLSDTQSWLRNTSGSDHTSRVATGVCIGPLYQMSHNGLWIADFGSVCGFASDSTNASQTGSQFSGAFGISPINVWGLRFTVLYDPVLQRMQYGVGLSLTGVLNQIAPSATPAPTPAK